MWLCACFAFAWGDAVGAVSRCDVGLAMSSCLCFLLCPRSATLHFVPRFTSACSFHIVDPTTSSSGMGQDVASLRCRCFFVGAGDVFGRVSRSAALKIKPLPSFGPVGFPTSMLDPCWSLLPGAHSWAGNGCVSEHSRGIVLRSACQVCDTHESSGSVVYLQAVRFIVASPESHQARWRLQGRLHP